MANPPPPYSETDTIPTLYDDTHRGLWGFDYSVGTIGNSANLIGYLEHHDPQTDGSFGICVAGGNGVCVSKTLYESIPEPHRPPLDRSHSQPCEFTLFGTHQTAIGSTIVPIILTNKRTGKRFRIKLYALVLEHMLMGMFISFRYGPFKRMSSSPRGGWIHSLQLGPAQELVEVEGC